MNVTPIRWIGPRRRDAIFANVRLKLRAWAQGWLPADAELELEAIGDIEQLSASTWHGHLRPGYWRR